jgi:hypothetical protein
MDTLIRIRELEGQLKDQLSVMKMVTSLGRAIMMQHSLRFWSDFHPWGELGGDAWDQQVVEEEFKH